MQFDFAQVELEGSETGILGTDDRVQEVKMAMGLVKEGMRGIFQAFSFRRMSRLKVRRLAEAATRNLNSFLEENGLLGALSPLPIVVRGPPTDARSCPLDFGARAETLDDSGWFQNSSMNRSILAIALGPSLRRKNGKIFAPLATVKRLSRKKWTEIPLPKWCADRAHCVGGGKTIASIGIRRSVNRIIRKRPERTPATTRQ